MSTNPFRPRTFGSTVWAALILRQPNIQQWGEYHACRVATIDNLDRLFDEQTDDGQEALSLSAWISDSIDADVAHALSGGFPIGYVFPTRADLIDDLGSVIRDLHDAVGTATSSLDPRVRRNAGEPWSIDHVPPNMFGGGMTWSAWTVAWGYVRNGITVAQFDPSAMDHPIDAFQSLLASYVGDGILTLPKSTIALLLEEWVRVVWSFPGDPEPAPLLRPKPGDRLVITRADVSGTSYPVGQVVAVTDNTNEVPGTSIRAKAVDGPITSEMHLPSESVEDRGWEFETTTFVPDTVNADEVQARIDAAVQAAVEAEREKHRADMAAVGRRFWQEARSRGWCSEAESVISDLNPILSVPLPEERESRYRVTYTGEIRIPFTWSVDVTAISEGDAWNEAPYPTVSDVAEDAGGWDELERKATISHGDLEHEEEEIDD